jgi:hypothetical protein
MNPGDSSKETFLFSPRINPGACNHSLRTGDTGDSPRRRVFFGQLLLPGLKANEALGFFSKPTYFKQLTYYSKGVNNLLGG